MALYEIPFCEAQENLAGRNRHARWYSLQESLPEHAVNRMKEGIVRPSVNVTRRIGKSDKIFTVGSCFARSVECALNDLGYNATSLAGETEFGVRNDTGFVNRYNTYSIRNELEWAADKKRFPDEAFARVDENEYVDLYSHPVRGMMPIDQTRERRRKVIDYFRRAYGASVVTVTLGLIEGWYDKALEDYINFAPIFGNFKEKRPLLNNPDRFEFRVISYEENMANLEAVYRLLKAHNPNCHIIVTVSPVAVSATFSNRDVIVANTFSKTILRTCAETWQRMHQGHIDYFPSYEMAMNSKREIVWGPDGMHVRNTFVKHIVQHFADNFIEANTVSPFVEA